MQTQTFPPKTIAMSQLNWEKTIKKVFCDQPVLIVSENEQVKINKIRNNLVKEIQNSTFKTLIVVDLITEQEKNTCRQSVKNTKISFELPLKGLFDRDKLKQGKQDEIFQDLNIKNLLEKQDSQKKQSREIKEQKNELKNKQKHYGSWSIRIFPFHKTANLFSFYLPQCIVPMSTHDIFSYKKIQRFCKYEYIFALQGYQQRCQQKLQTQIYLNWGHSQIQFVIFNEQKKHFVQNSKHGDIIIIPPMFLHKWRVIDTQKKVGKMITWKILPKSTFSQIVKNLQPETRKFSIPYPIHQILIDYCFHQFALIELQSEQLMYTLANLLNRQFLNELYLLQHVLKLSQSQIQNGANDKKIDECQICGNFIVNYFGYHKNVVSCLKCVQNDIKIQKVFQKIPKLIFEEGCQLLTRIKSYKQQKQDAKQCVYKLMENAVFFQYEDICDGDFIGSYHSIHCRINQTNIKKPRNSKERIVQNTINRLKKDLEISNPIDLIKKYSAERYQNDQQKKLFRQILTRASCFMTKKQEADLLSEMLPNYQQNNLKLFAIKLCVKDNP